MPLQREEREELSFRLSTVFKPAAPISNADLFSGRKSQTQDVLDAINQTGQHVVMYGERGVGKTSLANIIFSKLICHGWHKMTPIINCNATDSYEQIWGGVFSEIHDRAKRLEIAIPRPVAKYLRAASDGQTEFITPDVVRRVLAALSEGMLLVVILDEFDTIGPAEVRRAMADTIKLLSDRGVSATIVLVGVADDVRGLLADHQSIQRCLVQVRMPRMSRDELEEIVRKCLYVCTMAVDAPALHEISRLSKGLPHYAHLLGLHSGRTALEADSKTVKQSHVQRAVQMAIGKVELPIMQAYTDATTSFRADALYRQVLTSCAMVETDQFGYFQPATIREPLARILGRPCLIEQFARHLHTFCEDERGPVLTKTMHSNRPRFRFVNTLMPPFLLMKGLADGLITEHDLQATRDMSDPQGRLF